jgi:hypothetical protein
MKLVSDIILGIGIIIVIAACIVVYLPGNNK